MIRPAAFGFNPETAASNAMQRQIPLGPSNAAAAAMLEFDGFVAQLRAEGVKVLVCDDAPEPLRPDAVFPNNWISFHADGTVVLYPMMAPSRRLERRPEILDTVVAKLGFKVTRTVDLTAHERAGRFLEGTGSLILDHVARVAYASRSPRTDENVVREWCKALDFDCELFDALDADGRPYYHTNIIMSIGTRFALLASETLPPGDRDRVLSRLAATGRAIVTIDRHAIDDFCGNVLELASWDELLGDIAVLAMSRRARAAFAPGQLQRLQGCVDAVVAVPLDTIETLGGGGARCMLAEVFGAARQ
jgi:hypothetical protein